MKPPPSSAATTTSSSMLKGTGYLCFTLAMGTPGSPPQPVTEVLVNILDFGMHPKEAADAPRFWAFRGEERQLEIESRISDDVRKIWAVTTGTQDRCKSSGGMQKQESFTALPTPAG